MTVLCASEADDDSLEVYMTTPTVVRTAASPPPTSHFLPFDHFGSGVFAALASVAELGAVTALNRRGSPFIMRLRRRSYACVFIFNRGEAFNVPVAISIVFRAPPRKTLLLYSLPCAPLHSIAFAYQRTLSRIFWFMHAKCRATVVSMSL